MSLPEREKPFTIAIIGGGISGLVFALALHRRGIPFTIYERAQAFGEIGAGVGIGPNATRALALCDPRGAAAALARCATTNGWAAKSAVWFEFFDGTADTPAQELAPRFAIDTPCGVGRSGVHRAHFLGELVELLPEGRAEFNKTLEEVVEEEDAEGWRGRMVMRFRDGTTARADAVVGCDGIKSRTREIVLGQEHSAAKCVYTYKYAYRGLIPMEDAIGALGEEKAMNSCIWLGQDRHALTFPVNHGKVVNLVAFATTDKEWPSQTQLTLPATREEALEDFKHFGSNVKKLITLIKEKPDRWGIFDLGEHPVPTFCKGCVCLMGDAAHASSPHHGAGAGFGIEDAAVLASLLEDDRVQNSHDLQTVFAVYDMSRRERCHWLVQSSRRLGDLYEWLASGVGGDWRVIEKELKDRVAFVWEIDLDKAVDDARRDLGERLSRGQ